MVVGAVVVVVEGAVVVGAGVVVVVGAGVVVAGLAVLAGGIGHAGSSSLPGEHKAYSAAAPRLLNSLPPEIRSCTQLSSFQSHVKHHLSNMAFPELIN